MLIASPINCVRLRFTKDCVDDLVGKKKREL